MVCGAHCEVNGLYVLFGIGGGYYSYNKMTSNENLGDYDGWFGLGGCWCGRTDLPESHIYSKTVSTAGSGGTAGQGGEISISKTANVEAYNGNRITNDDYETIYYEYNPDGTEDRSKILEVLTRENINGEQIKFIPARIFIQDGIKRAVYDNYCYMPQDRKEKYGVTDESSLEVKNISKNGAVKCVKIVQGEDNVTHSRQGIGSGAGYIEISNGTFNEID